MSEHNTSNGETFVLAFDSEAGPAAIERVIRTIESAGGSIALVHASSILFRADRLVADQLGSTPGVNHVGGVQLPNDRRPQGSTTRSA